MTPPSPFSLYASSSCTANAFSLFVPAALDHREAYERYQSIRPARQPLYPPPSSSPPLQRTRPSPYSSSSTRSALYPPSPKLRQSASNSKLKENQRPKSPTKMRIRKEHLKNGGIGGSGGGRTHNDENAYGYSSATAYAYGSAGPKDGQAKEDKMGVARRALARITNRRKGRDY